MVSKQNILIISPTLPNPMMSAGDYRVFNLIKELKKYFNILFMPLDYKNYNNVDLKKLLNFVKICKPINSTTKFKIFLQRHKISVCIIEKYFSIPFETCKFLPFVKVPIVDVHELGFLKSQALSKLQKITNLKLFKAKELLFYKNAQILVAITEKEKEILKKYFPDKKIIVVPTCTTISNSIKKNFNIRKNICYLGYFHHKPNIDAVNYFIKNIFGKIKEKIPNIKFHILGYGSKNIKNTDDIISVDNIKNISNELSKYRVFVCPLRYGAGLKKKVLDAMSAKTPIVSTAFGTEGIKNIEKNFFNLSDKKFVNQIVKLYTNKNFWQKESDNNFNIVKKYYSTNSFKKYVNNLVKQIKPHY